MTPQDPSRRRLVRGAILAAIIFLVGDVALALALADDPVHVAVTPPPGTFGTPAPAIGDVVTYAHIREGAEAQPHFQFEWVGQGTFLDGDGQPTRYHLALTSRNEHGVEVYDARDGRFIGERYLHEETESTTPSFPLPVGSSTRTYTSNQTLFYGSDFRGFELLCGARHGLQGSTSSLAEPVPLLSRCALPALDSLTGSGPHLFRADRTETLGERQTVVFVLDDAPAPTQHNPLNDVTYSVVVWLSADIPYPLRIETIETEHMDGRDVARSEAVVLTGFTPGNQALDLTGPPGTPAPGLEYRPVRPWGIDDAGIDHPFPLSKAYDQALTNADYSELRDFLASHPDAFTSVAAYVAFHRDESITHRWTITVADRADHVEFCSYRYQTLAPRPLGDVLGAPLDLGYGPLVEPCEWVGAPADPAQRPTHLPTAASLLARSQAYLDANAVPLRANAYDLFTCTPDCSYHHNIRAGATYHHMTDRPEGGIPFQMTEQSWRIGEIVVGPDGTTTGFSHDVQHDADRVFPTAAPAQSGQDVARPLGMEVAEVPVWSFPDAEVVIGMGVVAAGAGALYALWPSLKTLGAALFSRVERPRALDHPQRRRLEALLTAAPGLTVAEMARRLDASRGAIAHHLAQMRSVGLVTSERVGRRTCHFLKGTLDRRLMEAAPLVAPHGARTVLNAMSERPDLSVSELAAQTGLAPSTVHHHLERFEQARLVERHRSGRTVRHRLTGLGAASLSRLAGT